MQIVPAIDLIDGENVRLTKGDYDQKTLMDRTPEETVTFFSQFPNVSRIQVVDLIGAREQAAQETSLVAKLKQLTNVPLEIGGGLRDMETIDLYDSLGIDYFVIGTMAVTDVEFLKEVVSKYPYRVYVCLDAIDDRLMVNGWTQDSGRRIQEYLEDIEDLDLAGVIYTDIEKEGTESGPNVERAGKVNSLTNHLVIASGGVRGQEDLDALKEVGISETIVGKAAYKLSFWENLAM